MLRISLTPTLSVRMGRRKAAGNPSASPLRGRERGQTRKA